MAYFSDAQEVYETIGKLFQDLAGDEELGPKFRKANTIVRYEYREPDSTITVRLQEGQPGDVDFGESDMEPEVTMSMEADTAHRFWLGQVNVTVGDLEGNVEIMTAWASRATEANADVVVFLDTFGSDYGDGWQRDNSFLTHRPTGTFCYGLFARRESLSPEGERYRATVTPADSAADALARYAEGRPDVLVSDIAMPEMDGFALIRRIRAQEAGQPRSTPAIALTAFASPEDRQRILLAGFQGHLAKPIHPGELVAAIASLTGRTYRR